LGATIEPRTILVFRPPIIDLDARRGAELMTRERSKVAFESGVEMDVFGIRTRHALSLIDTLGEVRRWPRSNLSGPRFPSVSPLG
jgi:hypothetical protein